MRGRWAAGIVPRNFVWIIQDKLAVSERPGGQTSQHRKVRRQEEIIWLKGQGFTRVVSLLASPHNLHAYDERDLPSAHFALPVQGDPREVLDALYPALLNWLQSGERLLLHQDELSERVSGVIAGFLCWCGVIPDPPSAIVAVEQLMKRQMGSAGRSIVAVTHELTPPSPGTIPAPVVRPAPEEVPVEVAPEVPVAPVVDTAKKSRPSSGIVERGIVERDTGGEEARAEALCGPRTRLQVAEVLRVMDRVEIKGLRVLGHHGALPGEQDRAQPFELDIAFSYEMDRGSLSDELGDAVDYGAVIGRVAYVVTERRFALLEALSDAVCRAVLEDVRIGEVEVRLHKLRPPVPEDVISVGVVRHLGRTPRADGS